MRAIEFERWSAGARCFGRPALNSSTGSISGSRKPRLLLFLAFFPARLFVVSLAGVLPLDQLLDRMVATVSRVAPGDVVAIDRPAMALIGDAR
jgi:hypothetical protein